MRTHERGGLRLTVLTDGPIELPPGDAFYTGEDLGDEASAALNRLNGHPATFAQNPLLIESPVSERTLIDTGLGQHTLLDSPRFGPASGHLADDLAHTGIDPDSIDRVLITHLHPDHCWGLIRPDGTAAFPRARLHLHADEFAHWTRLDGIDASTAPTDARRHLGALLAVQPYRDRLDTFEGETWIADDLVALPHPGHTPGHTAYRFMTPIGDVLSWGDCFHHTAQVEHPAINARTDVGGGGVAERHELLDQLSETKTLVHAYHFPYPGLGTVGRDTEGRFRWQPQPV